MRSIPGKISTGYEFPIFSIASASMKSKLRPAPKISGITFGPSKPSMESLTESLPGVKLAQASSVGKSRATSIAGLP